MKSTRDSTSSEDVRLISTQNCNFLDRKNMPIELVDIAGNVRVNRDSSDRPRLHTLFPAAFFRTAVCTWTQSRIATRGASRRIYADCNCMRSDFNVKKSFFFDPERDAREIENLAMTIDYLRFRTILSDEFWWIKISPRHTIFTDNWNFKVNYLYFLFFFDPVR